MNFTDSDHVIRLNVFISSPGDVGEERDAAEVVIKKLSNNPFIKRHFDLRPLRWEKEVPSAAMNPQDAVDYYMGKASDAHIFLSIFCQRMGTPFTHPKTGEKFNSGSEYEFTDAYQAMEKEKRPHIMLYRGTRQTGYHDKSQKELVSSFFDRIGGNGSDFQVLVRGYDTIVEFAEKYEQDLNTILSDWIQNKTFMLSRLQPKPKHEVVTDSSRINFDIQLPIYGRETVLKTILTKLESNLGITVIGLGGVGKSRLAAEIAKAERFTDGVVWHEITSTSTVENLTQLLADRIGLDRDSDVNMIWKTLDNLNILLVLDNAEDCADGAVRQGYIDRLKAIRLKGGTRVVMTSRERWNEIQAVQGFTIEELQAPVIEAAIAMLRSLYERDNPAFPLDNHEVDFVTAAHNHPRLIEFGVRWLWDYDCVEVIRRLKTLEGTDAEQLIDGIVRRTLALLKSKPEGAASVEALLKLAVFRGGFTSDVVRYVIGNTDALGMLRRYSLLGMANGRYDVHPIVLSAVKADESALSVHYAYFKALTEHHKATQTYYELDADSANLGVAFEYVLSKADIQECLAFYDICVPYFINRNQTQRRLNWMEQIVQFVDANRASSSDVLIASVYQKYATILNASSQWVYKERLIKALTALETAKRYSRFEDDPATFIRIYRQIADFKRYSAAWESDKQIAYQEILDQLLLGVNQPFTETLIGEALGEALNELAFAYRVVEILYRHLGRLDDADNSVQTVLTLYRKSEEIYRSIGDVVEVMDIQNSCGLMYARLSRNASELVTTQPWGEGEE